MIFAAPIWLIGLVPWAALTVWLSWGRRRRVGVPFLELWRGPVKGPRAKRAVQVPPVALAAVIAALFVAVFAMARPMVSVFGGRGPEVVIVFDRGITMPPTRLRDAVDAAQEPIRRSLGDGPTRYLAVPAMPIDATDRSSLAEIVSKIPPTAADTGDALQRLVADQIKSSNAPILLFSDRAIETSDARVIQIPPIAPLQEAGISKIAARESPRAQVMVRVHNLSQSAGNATLRIESAGRVTEKSIELPLAGTERNEFIDVPALGQTVIAKLGATDDLDANNEAYLARSASWPRIEPRFPLPAELERMIDAYRKSRPAGESSHTVALTTDPSSIHNDDAAVVFASQWREARLPEHIEKSRVVAHRITDHVDWESALIGATVSSSPVPAGWQALVSVGDVPMIAIAPGDPRRVWIGFRSDRFARSADFVIFWTNVFDWVGAGGETFSADMVERLANDWRRVEPDRAVPSFDNGLLPGIYRREDGALRALNAAPLPATRAGALDWRRRLNEVSATHRGARLIASPLLLIAIVLVLVSAVAWRRASRST